MIETLRRTLYLPFCATPRPDAAAKYAQFVPRMPKRAQLVNDGIDIPPIRATKLVT